MGRCQCELFPGALSLPFTLSHTSRSLRSAGGSVAVEDYGVAVAAAALPVAVVIVEEGVIATAAPS